MNERIADEELEGGKPDWLYWYARYKGEGLLRERRVSLGVRDKQVAYVKALGLVKQAEREALGFGRNPLVIWG